MGQPEDYEKALRPLARAFSQSFLVTLSEARDLCDGNRILRFSQNDRGKPVTFGSFNCGTPIRIQTNWETPAILQSSCRMYGVPFQGTRLNDDGGLDSRLRGNDGLGAGMTRAAKLI